MSLKEMQRISKEISDDLRKSEAAKK